MRGAVLQRLKLANDTVELLAGFEIFKRHVHRASANANHFGSSTHASGVEHLGKHAPAAIDLTNDGIGVDLNPIQLHMRGNGGIDKPCGLHRHASRILVHCEQGQSIGFTNRASGTRRDDQHVRRRALHDKLLLPRQFETIAAAFRDAGDLLGTVLDAFLDGNADHGFAGQYAGEPAVTHRLIRKLQRLNRSNRCGQKWRWRQIAANFFKDDARLNLAHAHAAIGLGNEDAGKAHFGELFPQAVAETVFAAHVAEFAKMGDGCFARHEIPRAVAQHVLVVV